MSRSAEGWEIRGNPKIHRRQGRKMRKPGQPGDSSRGATGGPKPRGNLELRRWKRRRMRDSRQLEDPSPAEPEDAGCGATCNYIGRHDRKSRAAGLRVQTGRAEGCENRGNSKLHRGHSLRDAGFGATRRPSARLNGLMHGPSNLEFTLLRRQRLRSLASSFLAAFAA